MDLWVSFWSVLTNFIPQHGLLAVAAIVLLRSAAVPIPVPADLLVIMVGVRAHEAEVAIWPAWIVLSVATTIGAGLLYVFTRWLGQGDLIHYGHYVGLTPSRIQAAEERLDARGTRAIFLARIIPGLRLAIVAVCGMLRIPWAMFLSAVGLGALIYIGLCLALGFIFGEAIIGLLSELVFPLGLAEPLIGFGILLFWVRRARRAMDRSATRMPLDRSARIRAGALAGALAIGGATMLVNVLIYLGGPIATTLLSGTVGVASLIERAGGLASILGSFVGTIIVGIVWGGTYAVVDLRWAATWHDALRGLSFVALPLAAVLVVQLLAAAAQDLPLTAWLTEGSTETIRWGIYGVLMGLIYPVLRVRRVAAASRRRGTGPSSVQVASPLG